MSRPIPGVVLAVVIAGAATALPAAETFGNFHTLGVVLDCPAGSQPSAIREVRLFALGGRKPRRLLDPVQVADYRWYAGSVFDLEPGKTYRFRAEFVGPAGRVVHREEFSGRTRAEPGEPPAALREVHVAPTGNDAAAGTASSPKRTIAAAIKVATRPGTHVVIHRGTYHTGDLPGPGRGTARAPIVIRAAKGEQVVIDGSDPGLLTATWKDLGGGLFSAPSPGNTWVVAVEHLPTGRVRRLYPVGSLANLKAKRVGKSTFATYHITEAYFQDGSQIVINCPYYKPATMKFHVARRGGFVEHSRHRHVIYSDLAFRFFTGQVLYVNNSDDITIRRCRFDYCSLPIAVKRASSRLLVEGCRFRDDCGRWGFLPKGLDDIGFSGHIELGGVYLHSPYEGRGMVIRGNTFEGLFDGVHLAPMGPPPKVRTHETDFYDNRINGVCDDLIEADGQCRNLRIFKNRMTDYLSGISVAQGYQGPTYIVRNLITGAGNSTATTLPPNFEGFPVKTNGGTRYGQTGWVFFFHNTFHTSVPRTNAFRVQVATWRRLVSANNIWQGTRDGFVFWRREISPMSMTGDIVYPESGSLLKIVKNRYTTIDEARTVLPCFSGVTVVDPGLVDPARGDFRLKPGSPAIDAGVLIPGINDVGFAGKAPDIGAFEYRGERRKGSTDR